MSNFTPESWKLSGRATLLAATSLLLLATTTTHAQQITGTPGAPSATVTIDGKQLPPEPPKFRGVINEIAKDSKPYWPPSVVPPKGAPNVRWESGVGARDWLGTALKPGKHTIVFDFKYDGPGFGKGGTGVLSVDGKDVSRQSIPHSIAFLMAIDESFDIGSDTRTGVDDSYKLPFQFTGKIDRLTFNLGPAQLASNDQNVMRHALERARD